MKNSSTAIVTALFFTMGVLALGYILLGIVPMFLFAFGFLGGFILWLLISTRVSFSAIKVPYFLTLIFFIGHKLEERYLDFFPALSKITNVPMPDTNSVWVYLLYAAAGTWLFIPALIKRGYVLGYFLAWTFFTSMGITELAHFVFPFFTGQPYGYFPGMVSVIFLAPAAWWGMYKLSRPKPHKHIYDKDGKQICCTQEEKINSNAGLTSKNKEQKDNCCATNEHENHEREEEESGERDHDHSGDIKTTFQMFVPAIISLFLLLIALSLDNYFKQPWFTGWIRIAWYTAAYLPVGFPVLKEAFESIRAGEIFSEFLLMSIATVGAFAIKEYPEGVAVMLFYAVGEVFQTLAVKRAKANIKSLLDQRPDEVTIIQGNSSKTIKAESANVGDIVQLKSGEKLGLDGELLSETASFNTAALTGESKPDTKQKGEVVLAGMINLNSVAQVKVTTAYKDSKLSKILELVQNATAQKAPTELFIRKFAKIYTPIVVFLAIGICFLPSFFVTDYVFSQWLYRALVFLVISCPCALVISIPLGYFGGIGAASKNGILFKGSNFLDIISKIQNVVMDKTGTMTEGVFKVQEVIIKPDYNKDDILKMVNALESQSTHPVATAIHEYVGEVDFSVALKNVKEISGHGLKAEVNGKELLVGNFKLLDKFSVSYDVDPSSIVYTLMAIAYDKKFAGYVTIADSIKDDAQLTIDKLKALGVNTVMLSGDKANVVKFVADKLGIANSFGDLLPEDKVNKVKEIKAKNETVAFVGDGVNDAPVVALSDVGIAMGGLGSDATIETADVVIQDDRPSKIPMAINIGKQTKRIVWQNITLAFVVKGLVLILGAGGLATMWEAVFADVGVALLAILNAVRIQSMKF